MHKPDTFYQQKQQLIRMKSERTDRQVKLLGWLRLLIMAGLIPPAWILINGGPALLWAGLIALLVVFIVLLNVHKRLQARASLLATMKELISGELNTLRGEYAHQEGGSDFSDPEHPFSADLDLFGRGSVFQMLNRTVTLKGREALAGLLKRNDPGTSGDCLQRQEVLRELSSDPELLLELRTAGSNAHEAPGDHEQLLEWLRAENYFLRRRGLRILCMTLSIVTGALAVYALWQGSWNPFLGIAIAANWMLLIIYGRETKRAFFLAVRSAGLVAKYEGMMQIQAASGWEHPVLKQMKTLAGNAFRGVTPLRKLIQRVEQRQHPFVGPVMNSLFLYDLRNAIALEKWRRNYGHVLVQYMDAAAETDARVALAGFVFNHPEYAWPEWQDNSAARVRAVDLRHPLLPQATAVGNDFELGGQERLYLLTGANMTGKSTFMRTLGVSLVMAGAGLPVAAAAYTCTRCVLYTSMRMADSVQDDISYFKAELNRLQSMFRTIEAAGIPALVLLDEPLRGTNSRDKQAGTEAIIRKLVRMGVTGIAATHDTSLARLNAELEGKVSNYHFESGVAEGVLQFDFKLKSGSSTSANATMLMKNMGIID